MKEDRLAALETNFRDHIRWHLKADDVVFANLGPDQFSEPSSVREIAKKCWYSLPISNNPETPIEHVTRAIEEGREVFWKSYRNLLDKFTEISAKLTAAEENSRRQAEAYDELNKKYRDARGKVKELELEVEDWRNDQKRVMEERCGDDRRHCTCVPGLRREIKKLRGVAKHNLELALEKERERHREKDTPSTLSVTREELNDCHVPCVTSEGGATGDTHWPKTLDNFEALVEKKQREALARFVPSHVQVERAFDWKVTDKQYNDFMNFLLSHSFRRKVSVEEIAKYLHREMGEGKHGPSHYHETVAKEILEMVYGPGAESGEGE